MWRWVRTFLLALTASVTITVLPIWEVDASALLFVAFPVLIVVITGLDENEKGARRHLNH